MTATTTEWQVVALFADTHSYTSLPVRSREAALAVAVEWLATPDTVDVKLIKRTVVCEEEAI